MKESSTPQFSQKLVDVNKRILPRFHFREGLKHSLQVELEDPVLKDSIERQIIDVRNEIIMMLLEDIPDFFEAVINKWGVSFKNGDVKSLVHENLLEAVQRYNPNIKPFCKFTTFFWMYNQNILRNHLRRARVDKRDDTKTDSLDTLVEWSRDSDKEFSLHDFIITEREDNQLEAALTLRHIYVNANPLQRRILKRMYLGYNQSQTSTKLKISGTYLNAILRQLREQFADALV